MLTLSDIAEWVHCRSVVNWDNNWCPRTTWQIIKRLCLPLKYLSPQAADKDCPHCHLSWRPLYHTLGYVGQITSPVSCWQIDYIGPLPVLKGTDMHWSVWTLAQDLYKPLPVRELIRLQVEQINNWRACTNADSYSDQGSCFTGHDIQEWTEAWDILLFSHLPCSLTAAGLTGRMTGLIGNTLKILSPDGSLKGWSPRLTGNSTF